MHIECGWCSKCAAWLYTDEEVHKESSLCIILRPACAMLCKAVAEGPKSDSGDHFSTLARMTI
jgi:hypothetical protein